MPDAVAAMHGPYEDLAIEAIKLVGKIIDSQPKDVQAELWRMYVQDMKDWREFWKAVKP